MRVFRSIGMIAVAAVGWACSAGAQTTRPSSPGVKIERDINYGDGSKRMQALDLYVPEKPLEHDRPLLIYVHGGGWKGGDKASFPAKFLLDRGYAVASVNYRLTDEAIFPAQIEDCKAAVRWLRAHASEYHINKDRIGVMGDSAGGHLVALLGTSGGVKELEGHVGKYLDVSSRVQCVVDWYGPTDMSVFFRQAKDENIFKPHPEKSPLAELFGGMPADKPDLVRLANPVAFVSPDDPPFLIQHGDKDTLVPVAQSEMLADALKKAGVEVEIVVIPGAGHGFGPKANAIPAVERFLDKHLK